MKTYAILLMLAASVSVAFAQDSSLSGKITDAVKKPIPGATIHLLNTNIVAVTDGSGDFSITGLTRGNYAAEITALGFATVQKSVATGVVAEVTLAESLTELDAIVVTAEKKEEDLQSIPASISSLSAAKISDYRIWNTKDITAIVPNLYSANPGDGRNVTSIRGVTTTSYDPSVATYVDGVNQFGLDTYIAQLFDVERIEVLRGPQGTLYGRNAMGGVVNIITKAPGNTTRGFAEVSLGAFDQQRYSAGFRTPLIKDKLFLGIAGVYDHLGGFSTNDFNNSKFDRRHSVTGNYYLKYIAGQRWVLTLNVKHNANRNYGAFPLTFQGAALENPFHLSQNAVAKMIDNVFNSSLSAVYAGERFNFSSQTSYQSNYRYYKTPIDGDFTSYDAVSIVNNYGKNWNNVKALTQEFRFSSPASASAFQWTAGAYLFYQHAPNKQAIRFGEDAPLYNPDITDTNFSTISTTKSTSTGGALFGQASYALTDRLTVTAGLRYDAEHKKQNVLGEYQHDPDPNPMFETQPDTSASVSFHAFSPKLNLSWKPSDRHLLYASWSRGYRTGGLTPLSSDPSQLPLYPYKPEYSNNLEAGIKNTFFANRLRANLTFFYITITDAQIPTLVVPNTIISNAGSLTSKGAELELSATLARGLQLEYNLGINDARFGRSVSNGEFIGKHQIFTPPVTSMAAVQYAIGLSGNTYRIIVRGEWMYLGDTYFNYNQYPLVQSAYSLFNSKIGFGVRNFELTFWGRNLGDQTYIDYAYDFGVVHLGNPRNFGVTLRANF